MINGMNIVAVDVETTGIPSETDKQAVVELGWSRLPAQGWDSQLVFPERNIPFDAMAVHHITDGMVAKSPTWNHVWPSVLGPEEINLFVAHNVDYERKFLATEIPFVCTYKVALRIWPDMPSHSLQYLRYALALLVTQEITMPHRAGPDAYVCALLMERIMSEPNAPDIETMVRWSNGHPLLPRCPLFKHKGKKWEDVPTDYLDWIVNKPNDVSPEVKANARLWLGKR